MAWLKVDEVSSTYGVITLLTTDRAVEVNKVSGNYLPMSSYMLEAVKAIQETESVLRKRSHRADF